MTTFGIDFGTTNSVVAILDKGTPEVIRIDEPPMEWEDFGYDHVLPSVFGYGEEREPLFGWKAKSAKTLTKIEAVKRLFATEHQVTIGDEPFLVDEVATMIFAHIKRMAALQSGLDLNEAVVTIPANSRGLARQRTKICAGMAGINVLALINEPTAAALAALRRHREDQTVMVVDWGGGTLDVTILEAVDGIFMEQTSRGKQRCGGLDFDARIMKRLAESDPGSDAWSGSQRQRLRLEVEKAKIYLSSVEETNIRLPGGRVYRLSRDVFNKITKDIIDQVGYLIVNCLQDMVKMKGEVDSLVLVGGTCKIPAVRQQIKQIVGLEPITGLDPLTAIAEGATIAAGIMQGELPDYGFFVSTEHALGTVSITEAMTLKFSPIIPRGHKLPAERSESFSPITDEQDSLRFCLIEGDPDKPLHDEENVILYDDTISILNPGPRDEVSFAVTYKYDLDGIVSFDVVDERDNSVLKAGEIALGIQRDRRQMVGIANRVEETLREGVVKRPVGVSKLDPELTTAIANVRTMVAPFVDDIEAIKIKNLCEQIESSGGADQSLVDQLMEINQKYNYLF